MRYQLDIDCGIYDVNISDLQTAITTVLSQQQVEQGGIVSVQIMDNTAIQQLNREFRGIDTPTDVLSFPAEVPPLPDDADNELASYLGDLAIAHPYASAQAKRLGHDLQHSLMLLVIHGALHLLGYDHDTVDNRTAMWSAQEAALNKLNIPLDIVPSLEDVDEQT